MGAEFLPVLVLSNVSVFRLSERHDLLGRIRRKGPRWEFLSSQARSPFST